MANRTHSMKAVELRERLVRAFSPRVKRRCDMPGAIKAAVLILLYPKRGVPYTLFTQRSSDVSDHKGEISFPGGVYEEADGTLVKTALRELQEEIGITLDESQVLGELDDVYTFSTGFAISPFVAFTSNLPTLRPNPKEIVRVIEVPILSLLEPNRLRREFWTTHGMPRILYFYRYGRYVIWGATARILKLLLELACENSGK